MPTEIDYARLAAYIDGEGSIRIYKRKSKGCTNPNYRMEIRVYNTDVRLVRWCKETFGGSISGARSKGPGCRPELYWVSHTSIAEELLVLCRPYLLIKGERADLALAFRKTYSESRRDGTKRGHFNETSIEMQYKREQLRLAMLELNKKGAPSANV